MKIWCTVIRRNGTYKTVPVKAGATEFMLDNHKYIVGSYKVGKIGGIHVLRSFYHEGYSLPLEIDIDEDLIRVAAEQSRELGEETADGDLRRAIEQLSMEERDSFLMRLATGEPHLTLTLNRRLGTLNGVLQEEVAGRRTVDDLFAAAEALRERRRREHAAAAEARRIAELHTLAGREQEAWREVDGLIQQSRARAYEETVQLLKDLRELAEYQNRRLAFEGRLARLCDQYGRRHALMRRLREAGLLEQREID